MSTNTEHILNLTSIASDTLHYGLSGLREYVYITAVTGVISVISFCALLVLYMLPMAANFRIIGLALRLTVLLGAVNSFLGFMLMPPLAYSLTVFVVIVYTCFFLTACLTVASRAMRMGLTWYKLGFKASLMSKILIKPTGTDDWIPYPDCDSDIIIITVRKGKYYICNKHYDLEGKFSGNAATLQLKPSTSLDLKLSLDFWDGASSSTITYRGAATSGKAAYLIFGATNTTV